MICRKTMRSCQTPSMCAPFGGCSISSDCFEELKGRVAKLEKWTHEPFDFSNLVARLEKLERNMAHVMPDKSDDI